MKKTLPFNHSFFSIIFREKNQLYHSKAINKLLFINDSSFYSGSRDSLVKLWSIDDDNNSNKTALNLIANYDNHYNWVTDLSISLPKNFLFSCSNDQSICQWDLCSHSLIKKFQVHKDYITAIQYNNSKEYLYSSGLDGQLYEINIDRGKETSWICDTGNQSIYSFDSSKDGNEFLVSSYDNALALYDARIKSNTIIKSFKGHSDLIRKVRLSSDSAQAISISNDATVRLWDIGQGKELHQFTFHSSPVMSLYVNDDFTRIITGSKDGDIYLIDKTNLVYTKVDQLPERILSIAMNQSETKLLLSSGSSLYHYQLTKEKPKEKHIVGLASLALNIDNNIRKSTEIVKDEMVECSVLKNKIYAIVKYKDNSIALFNLYKLKQIYRNRTLSYEELKIKLNKLAIANKLKTWCLIDIKLGCLTMEIQEKMSLINKTPVDVNVLEKYIDNNFNDLQLELDLVLIEKDDVKNSSSSTVKDKGKGKEAEKRKEKNKDAQINQLSMSQPNTKDEPSFCSILFDQIVFIYFYWRLYSILSRIVSLDLVHNYIKAYLKEYFRTNIDCMINAIATNNGNLQIAFFDYNSTENKGIQLLYLIMDLDKDKDTDNDIIAFPQYIYNKDTYSLFKTLHSPKETKAPQSKMLITLDKRGFKVPDQDKKRDRVEELEINCTCFLFKLYSFLIDKLNKKLFQEYVFNEIRDSNLTQKEKNYVESVFLNDSHIFVELTLRDISLKPSNISLKMVKALLSRDNNMIIHMKHLSISELIERGAIVLIKDSDGSNDK